ncbi:MAG: hypothetical protein WED07_11260 [Candidatus Freyarchaeum deiterrae]
MIVLNTDNEPEKATNKLERAASEFSELLKKYKNVLSETISLVSEYKTEVFPTLEQTVDSASISEQVEAFKGSGRISAVSETKNLGIPLAICSTSYGEGNNKLFSTVNKIYEEFESGERTFNYFFFPDYEGKVDVSENFAKIVQSLFVEKISKSKNKGAIIINLRTLPKLPSDGSRIFVDKNFRRDPRNVLAKFRGSLGKSFNILDDENVLGGGSLTYCLKVMAELQNVEISVLDLTITSDIIEINKIRELIKVLCEIAEKEFT